MKFDKHEFFKHKNCMDAFIRVRSISVEGNLKSIIWVDWMVQGIDMHWFTPELAKRTLISADQYDNWIPYTPTGVCY
jgi:hypothetical protein